MKQINSSQKLKESNSDNYFESVKTENYNDTFDETSKWLRTVNTNLLTKNSERNSSVMKNIFIMNKAKLAYAFLILTFAVAACNYPVSQQETIGDVLTWSVNSENMDAIKKIESIDWVKNGQTNVNEKNINGKQIKEFSVVLLNTDNEKIQEYRNQIEKINGISSIKLTLLNETVTRPVYSVALNELFKIDINAENMSDSELEKEITEQLKRAGIDVITFDFTKDENGRRIVNVKIPEDSQIKNGGFDMTIKDGNNVNRIKEVRKTDGDVSRFKGKTDKEIKQMVKENLKDANLKDDEIIISREGDKVMIQIKKEEGSKKGNLEIEEIEK